MSEKRNVVGLRGEIPHGTVDDDLVRQCRELLRMAETGEMRGMACCYERSDAKVTTLLHTNGNHFAMSHALGALWWRFQQKMYASSEGSP